MTTKKGYIELLREVLQRGNDDLADDATEAGREAVSRINTAIEAYLVELGFDDATDNGQPRYTVTQRPAALGGGWTLKLFDENGEEMGGGVFPPDPEAESPEQAMLWAYNDAAAEGDEWVQSRQE